MPGGSRVWTFTLNNPQSNSGEIGSLEGPIIQNYLLNVFDDSSSCFKFLICQLEVGVEGTPHLQGYCVFNDKPSIGVVKRRLHMNSAHLEYARGSPEENVTYCSKPEGRLCGPWIFGEKPRGQGTRTDLQGLCDLVNSGATFHEIAMAHPVEYAKYSKHCHALRLALNVSPLRPVLQIITIVGPSDVGKTHWAFEHFPELYRVVIPMRNNPLWWDGYEGQETILFDDFYGEICLTQMLHILDRFPLTLPVKGSMVPAMYTRVIITSNDPPETWYNSLNHSPSSIGALMRRLTTCGSSVFNVATRTDVHCLQIATIQPVVVAPIPTRVAPTTTLMLTTAVDPPASSQICAVAEPLDRSPPTDTSPELEPTMSDYTLPL